MSDQVVLSEKGVPFQREQDAKAMIQRRGFDKKYHKVIKYQGGWAIARDFESYESDRQAAIASQLADTSKKEQKSGYHVINIQPASSPNDLKIVPLSLNGQCIRCKRGVDICLPDPFIQVLEHATETRYHIVPGEPRTSEEVPRFPFSIVRESDEAEFKRMFKRVNAV